jgi:hypothetical protein
LAYVAVAAPVAIFTFAERVQLLGPEHARGFQFAAASDDVGKRQVDAVEKVINGKLFGNVKISHVASFEGDVVRAAFGVSAPALPVDWSFPSPVEPRGWLSTCFVSSLSVS